MAISYLQSFTPQNGVYFFTEEQPFEEIYLEVREKEGRVYSDQEVQHLPHCTAQNTRFDEWQLRVATANNFNTYLQEKGAVDVLDLGCGNGWFSNFMAKATKGTVVGVDINRLELEQAARVFPKPNLHFVYANIFTANFPLKTYDIITLNGSVQYFPDLVALIERLLTLLKPGGELHFLDSPFYKAHEIEGAQERSLDYYQHLGYESMADHYFHHPIDVVKQYDYTLLYKPRSVASRWLKLQGSARYSPFPWIRIRKTK